jgi:hypothetical protein
VYIFSIAELLVRSAMPANALTAIIRTAKTVSTSVMLARKLTFLKRPRYPAEWDATGVFNIFIGSSPIVRAPCIEGISAGGDTTGGVYD